MIGETKFKVLIANSSCWSPATCVLVVRMRLVAAAAAAAAALLQKEGSSFDHEEALTQAMEQERQEHSYTATQGSKRST